METEIAQRDDKMLARVAPCHKFDAFQMTHCWLWLPARSLMSCRWQDGSTLDTFIQIKEGL